MQKNILTILVIVLGIFGLMWWGKSAQKPLPAQGGAGQSALSAEETLYDFRQISMKDGVVSRSFQIKNDGEAPVKIEKIYTSCMCTAAWFVNPDGTKIGPFGMPGHGGNTAMPGHGSGQAGALVNPGESREIYVEYDPNAHGPAGVGAIDRLVYLEDDSGKTLELEIKAVVTP